MFTQYLVVYDISDPRRLQRVAKVLLNYGIRVQKSVFEISLHESRLAGLIEVLKGIVEESEDGIKIFRLCALCENKRVALGIVAEKRRDFPWIIL